MRSRRRGLLLLLLLTLAGCDGHGRLLYLRPPGTAKPPWSASSVVIPISGDEDVPAIVAAVSADLVLGPRGVADGHLASWHVQGGDARGYFSITVDRADEGWWKVALLDWPSFVRSDYSVRAERAIRAALGTG